MRPRTLLVLLAVILAMAAFIWFVERDLPSTEERAENANKLIPFDAGAVRALAIEVGGRELRFERQEPDEGGQSSEWLLVEPPRGRADQSRIEDLLSLLADLEKRRVLEDVTASEVGLEVPRAVISLQLDDEKISLELGSAVPASSTAVVKVGDGPPYFVTQDSFFAEIDHSVDEWRSRDALVIEANDVTRLRVSRPQQIELERTGGSFALIAPVEDVADEDFVEGLLGALADLRIEEFLDDFGEASDSVFAPTTVLDVWANGQTMPVRVELAEGAPEESEEPEESSLLRVDGQVFTANTELATMLARPASAWRSPKWTDREVYEIENVAVSRPEGDLVLHRRDGEWRRGEDKVEYGLVSDLLYAITRAEGEPVEPPYGNDDGEAVTVEPRVSITLAASEWTEALSVFGSGPDHWLAREGRTVRLRAASETVEDLLLKLESLASAPVQDESESEALETES